MRWGSYLEGWSSQLDGGFKYLLFSPLFGQDFHFDQYFSNGLKPPTRQSLTFSPPFAGYALMTVCFVGMYMRARHFASRSWAHGKKGREIHEGGSQWSCIYVPTIECVLLFYCSLCMYFIYTIYCCIYIFLHHAFIRKKHWMIRLLDGVFSFSVGNTPQRHLPFWSCLPPRKRISQEHTMALGGACDW